MAIVIIRLWTNGRFNTAGHVSLDTGERYVSFYPDNQIYHEFTSEEIVKWIPGQGCLATLKHDLNRAYGKPVETLTLYTLKTDKINRKFEEFMAGDFAWDKLNGLSRFYSPTSYPQNADAIKSCSGLVASLLFEGGIDSLLSKPKRLLKGTIIGAVSCLCLESILLRRTSRSSSSQIPLDGDSTRTVGLAATSAISTGFLMMLGDVLCDRPSSFSPSIYLKAIIVGAFTGLACAHLRITDSGPPFPFRDVGRMVREAQQQEMIDLQISDPNDAKINAGIS